jgi:quercetin dioxygenase-like cupin family protein
LAQNLPAAQREKAVRRIVTSVAAIVVGLSVGGHVVAAQDAAPTENKGLKTGKSQVVDLGAEIEGMSGRQLRMRVLTIEPGGHIGIHSHKDRPAVAYFLQGTDTVLSADGTSKTLHAGDMSSANKDTTHWHRNDGNDDVVFVIVDVFHPGR